jgi:hypothetical protein
MSKQKAAQYIRDNIQLIKDKNFKEFYHKLEYTDFVSDVSEILLGSGVNPLLYLDEVPKKFLCNSKIDSITIPNSIKTIGEKAFNSCHKLTFVSIPDSVSFIGMGAFGRCSRLETVSIGEGLKRIDKGAFVQCDSIEYVNLPDSLTIIEPMAFMLCISLKEVSLPKGITLINDGAFCNCDIDRVDYRGTVEDWHNVTVGKGEFSGNKVKVITCLDGEVKL